MTPERLAEIQRTHRHATATRPTPTDSWLNGYQDDVRDLLAALAKATEALVNAGSELEAGNDRGAKHLIQDALDALRAGPAATDSPFTTPKLTEICGPGYGTADEVEAPPAKDPA